MYKLSKRSVVLTAACEMRMPGLGVSSITSESMPSNAVSDGGIMSEHLLQAKQPHKSTEAMVIDYDKHTMTVL